MGAGTPLLSDPFSSLVQELSQGDCSFERQDRCSHRDDTSFFACYPLVHLSHLDQLLSVSKPFGLAGAADGSVAAGLQFYQRFDARVPLR